MRREETRLQTDEATDQAPRYYEGPVATCADVHIQGRYFTYRSDAGLVAGVNLSVSFSLDRPPQQIWSTFKDFNLWQPHHYYSGVLGDLEGKTFYLSLLPNDPARHDAARHQYQVVKVIPEHLIVLHQPIPKGALQELPGVGGVSPGFHAFMLEEKTGKTSVTALMNHASATSQAPHTKDLTQQALEPWRDARMVPEWVRKWRDDFIPSLKKLVAK